jgi:hypothetical protein
MDRTIITAGILRREYVQEVIGQALVGKFGEAARAALPTAADA